MCRTDQHAPFAVRLARGDLASRANHDHRLGPCDLPPRSSYERAWPPATRCNWEFQFTGTYTCSCWMCHAGPQHRAEARRKRRHDHEQLCVALGHWRAGDTTAFDELPGPQRSRWW